ncbi:P-loop containing nucleoside triphosphate hydrolase protein [Lentinula edodes]|nr:P-loop containing nucleoside triphosphate hydrolase protein [Lentinula edodes]
MYRGLFKFGVFNAVQSSCFDGVAPTGSGKTVLFELSIIKMLSEARETGQSVKSIYVAPTKALCSERYRDWANKFEPLGIKCCELTGDTIHFGKSAWGDAKNATIILTRNWDDHHHQLSQIQLFLVDEVHILNETRGSTLEVVVSRMKLRGTAVRFVLVSATVPNIKDIASWIGKDAQHGSAQVYEFGEDYRPCKLIRHVVSFPRSKGQSDFVFSKNLDYKLFQTLQTYSVGKPILIFVSTRKGVFSTAEQLSKDHNEAAAKKQSLPWTRPGRVDRIFDDKRLSEFASLGIGVHHAGLTPNDRRTIEELFLNKILRIVIATTTLAVGVNLPAHTVIIKGVHTFQNSSSVEYSDLDVMQMLGRAGRPQFDKDGIAVIMCESELENKYRALVQGKTIVESSLHLNLSEHLNSEIGLGTITNVNSAKEWLKSSFLFQRIQKNPNHYSLGKDENQTWEERVDDIVMQSVESLRNSELVSREDGSDAIICTEYGDIMSKFYLRQRTMGLILDLSERASMREVIYNKLRRHNDMRYEVKKVERTSDKILLLIQAILGGISLNAPEYRSNDSQPQFEAYSVFKHLPRIARAIVEVAIVRRFGAPLKYGLELVRCSIAKAWEDRPVLAEHGITSIPILRKQDTLRLETLLNRRPPFGLEMLASAQEFPVYTLRVEEIRVHSDGGRTPVDIELSVECGLLQEIGPSKSKKQKPSRFSHMTSVLTLTSDNQFVDFRRIPTKALKEAKTFEICATLEKPSQTVIVSVCREGLRVPPKSKTGAVAKTTVKPNVVNDPQNQTKSKGFQSNFKRTPSKPKPKPRVKTDQTLDDLDKLHKSTNVQQNLKLSQGHRIKLDPSPSGPSIKRKNRPIPNFDIEFASIATVDTDILDLPASLDDDDDLPAPHEILASSKNKKRNYSSEDNYSNSELDALIRDIPSDDIVQDAPKTVARVVAENKEPAKKKFKLDTFPEHKVLSSNRKPLFLADNEGSVLDDDEEIEFVEEPTPGHDYDDFMLDSQYYNAIPATPDLTTSMRSFEDEEDELDTELISHDNFPNPPSSFTSRKPVNSVQEIERTTNFPESFRPKQQGQNQQLNEEEKLQQEYEDEFAILEAWIDEHME